MKYICAICKEYFSASEIYEYRGEYACEEHHDEMTELRDFERNEIIFEEDNKTKRFKGLDLSSDSIIGKANRKILARQIDIASKESGRIKNYEKRG